MSEPEPSFRNVWLSLAMGTAVMAVGSVFLRHDDDARGAFLFACIILTLVLHQVLDGLWRRKQRRSSRS